MYHVDLPANIKHLTPRPCHFERSASGFAIRGDCRGVRNPQRTMVFALPECLPFIMRLEKSYNIEYPNESITEGALRISHSAATPHRSNTKLAPFEMTGGGLTHHTSVKNSLTNSCLICFSNTAQQPHDRSQQRLARGTDEFTKFMDRYYYRHVTD